ncbi:orotidine 5'-phosphate decarboxylase [Virgibacillus sp. MSJ-26]|uniref:3-hexulose-6-phosphate synthase n=1 Tax=Virgibacillus sp. MSJ-26 TaxID=2841522 RepID=UPI001C110FCE|nr:3-hexulose-6-phosphate synthase [Virgibacillus sp. MSJ-26]MBU5468699.1 orotidine 5'-phosphate decarboxylase [Virgibacillus sp. MSJ-26]
MKLQLALDRLKREECFQILEETIDNIDIIEVGTGVIKEYGMSIVKEIKRLYPEKLLLADMKTCDAGHHEALQAFEAGADITTVMGFASDITITEMQNIAERYPKNIMVDLLEINSKKRIMELERLGVGLVSLHVGKDKQSERNFNLELFSLIEGTQLDIAVAGGINIETLQEIAQRRPDIIIVGSAITKAESPKTMAMNMKDVIREFS